jgi:hypothetical protein
MNITLTIPDANAGEMVDGICALTGWTSESGKTKAAWAKEKLVQWLKETAKRGLLKASQENINATIDAVPIT